MAELGVALLTFAPARTQDFVSLGRCAEERGLRRLLHHRVADRHALDRPGHPAGHLTHPRRQLRRRSATCGTRSSPRRWPTTASDLSGGRFVLGRRARAQDPRSRRSACPSGKPSVDLPAYVRDVKEVLAGRGKQRYPDLPPQSYQGRLLDFRTPEHPVPVYTAAVGPRMAEAGATVSDGVMAWLVPRPAIGELRRGGRPCGRADRTRRAAGRGVGARLRQRRPRRRRGRPRGRRWATGWGCRPTTARWPAPATRPRRRHRRRLPGRRHTRPARADHRPADRRVLPRGARRALPRPAGRAGTRRARRRSCWCRTRCRRRRPTWRACAAAWRRWRRHADSDAALAPHDRQR